MTQRDLNVGGVVEYFNAPILFGKEKKLYENNQINLIWHNCVGGTGEMLRKLEDGSLDVAILLTEGIATDICKGGKNMIVGTYVSSRLTWGIYSDINSKYSNIEEIINKSEEEENKNKEEDNKDKEEENKKNNVYTYAISRKHSGSHIMAYVDLLCRKFNFKKNDIKFFECKNFDGAKQALRNKQADFFMWETFTTSHMVENKEWKKIGERQTFWPAFVFASSSRFLENKKNVELLQEFVRITEKCCLDFKDEKNKEESISYINEIYKIKKEDANYLFKNVTYDSTLSIDFQALSTVFTYLKEAKVIEEEDIKKKNINEYSFVDTNICKIDAKLPNDMYDWRVKCMLNAINNILEEKKKKSEEFILVEDLIKLEHLDQYHYLGHIALDEIIDILNIQQQHYVLDVGGGIGGPARYICEKKKCKIVCVEIQKDLVDAAKYINQKCNLQNILEVVNGDILEINLKENSFDFFFSLLVILHIPNRLMALNKLFSFLKPGGKFIIEDLYINDYKKINEEDIKKLQKHVGCFSLTNKEEYEYHLKQAGFINLQFIEMSERWSVFAKERYLKLLKQQNNSFDDVVFNKRKQLYEVISESFSSGKISGLRIYGEKPL